MVGKMYQRKSWIFFQTFDATLLTDCSLSFQTLFSLLVQYYGDLAIQDPPHFGLMNQLTSHLYELTLQSPLTSGQAVLKVIKDKQEEFNHYCEARGGRGVFPTLDVVGILIENRAK